MTQNLSTKIKEYENIPDPKTKAELLERMAVTYDAAESLIAAYDEAAFNRPLTEEGWSAKNFIGHLMDWERGMVALLQKKDRFLEMGLTKEETAADIDVINDALYRQHKDRPFNDLLAAFRETHQELLAVLADLNDEDLQMPYGHYQPQAEGDFINNPVMGWLAGNTYGHYAEHIGDLGRLLQENP
ncbi:MAG: ClbS/DfsB family four-helix bundle protein [Candidatus Promineifilaceae bacterium]